MFSAPGSAALGAIAEGGAGPTLVEVKVVPAEGEEVGSEGSVGSGPLQERPPGGLPDGSPASAQQPPGAPQYAESQSGLGGVRAS